MFCQICKSSIRRFKEIEYKQKLKHAELFLTSYLSFFFFFLLFSRTRLWVLTHLS